MWYSAPLRRARPALAGVAHHNDRTRSGRLAHCAPRAAYALNEPPTRAPPRRTSQQRDDFAHHAPPIAARVLLQYIRDDTAHRVPTGAHADHLGGPHVELRGEHQSASGLKGARTWLT